MSYGMFDDLAVNDASVQKREARVTQTRALEMAIFASRDRFMPFLKNATTKQDLNDRLALVGNDLAKVISEHLTPVPAVMRRVRGALKTEWEDFWASTRTSGLNLEECEPGESITIIYPEEGERDVYTKVDENNWSNQSGVMVDQDNLQVDVDQNDAQRTYSRKTSMWEAEGNTMTLYGYDGDAFGTVTYYAEDNLGPESWQAEILGGQAQTFTSQDDAEEWLEEQQQKLSNKSKKTAWSFDRSLNAYALGSGTFDGYNCTECNAHHSKMGVSRCACGKIWNAWEVSSKGKTSSGSQYFFREVPRRDAILASRKRKTAQFYPGEKVVVNGVGVSDTGEDLDWEDTYANFVRYEGSEVVVEQSGITGFFEESDLTKSSRKSADHYEVTDSPVEEIEPTACEILEDVKCNECGERLSVDEANQAGTRTSRRKKADSPEPSDGPTPTPEAPVETETPSQPEPQPQQSTVNRPAPGEEDQAWEDSIIADIKSKLMELIEQESGEAVLRGVPVDRVLQPLVDAMRAIEGIEQAERVENEILLTPGAPQSDDRGTRDQMSPEEMQFVQGYKAGWKDTPLPKEAGQHFLEGYIKGSSDAILNDLGTSSDEDKSFREKLQEAIEVLREDTADAIDEDNRTPRDEEPFIEPAFAGTRPDWSYTDQFQDVTQSYSVPSDVQVYEYEGQNFHVKTRGAADGVFLTKPSLAEVLEAAQKMSSE